MLLKPVLSDSWRHSKGTVTSSYDSYEPIVLPTAIETHRNKQPKEVVHIFVHLLQLLPSGPQVHRGVQIAPWAVPRYWPLSMPKPSPRHAPSETPQVLRLQKASFRRFVSCSTFNMLRLKSNHLQTSSMNCALPPLSLRRTLFVRKMQCIAMRKLVSFGFSTFKVWEGCFIQSSFHRIHTAFWCFRDLKQRTF